MKYSVVTLALASSACASLQVRDASSIESDLSTIGTQLSALTDALNSYSGDIQSALPVEDAEQTLDQAIKSAASDVGTDVVSAADTSSILDSVNALIPNIISGLNAFVAKQSSFSSIGLGEVATMDIKALQEDTISLAGSLVAVAASESQAAATAASSCISAAFASAVAGSSATSCGGGSATPAPTSGSSSPSGTTSSGSPTSSPTSSASASPASTTSGNAAVATGSAGGLLGVAAAAAVAFVL